MGWSVIGLGTISVDEKHMGEIIDLMIGDRMKVLDRLTGTTSLSECYDVEGDSGEITFRMDGNKSIDYSKLHALKAYCINGGIPVEISVNEYVESSDGYYYNSEEDKDENEDSGCDTEANWQSI